MFSRMGVPTKKTPYEVSEASDVVITMLPSSAHVSIIHSSVVSFPLNTSHHLFVVSSIVLQQLFELWFQFSVNYSYDMIVEFPLQILD